jgi:hypothetical protein
MQMTKLLHIVQVVQVVQEEQQIKLSAFSSESMACIQGYQFRISIKTYYWSSIYVDTSGPTSFFPRGKKKFSLWTQGPPDTIFKTNSQFSLCLRIFIVQWQITTIYAQI